MRTPLLAVPCLLGAAVWPSEAHAAPGDLFVTESLGGSVLEFGDGGDLTDAQRFATGLTQPTGICRGPEGHIYVVETLPGEVTIIDDGGDMTSAVPFADGLPGIIGLWCDDERILTGIFISGIGVVINIAAGGSIPSIPVGELRVASNPSLTTAVVIDDMDNMYALGGDIWDVTGGGDHTLDPAYAFGVAIISGTVHGSMALGGQYQGPGIYDFTAGGDLTLATPWATLPDHGLDGVEALLDAGDAGVFAMIGNEIYDVTGGGDLTAASPMAFGLNAGLSGSEPVAGIEGMLLHVCSTHDDCADGDLCNGDEQCVDNACVDPAGPLECDDSDICTADACDAEDGCSNAAIDECCHDDLDCEIDEVCDGETDLCVPTDPTGGDASSGDDSSGGETTGDGTMSGTSGDTLPSSDAGSGSDAGESGDDDGGAAEAGEGCGCRAGQGRHTPFWLLFAAFVASRRRRRAA